MVPLDFPCGEPSESWVKVLVELPPEVVSVPAEGGAEVLVEGRIELDGERGW
jgi:hypothetical protein